MQFQLRFELINAFNEPYFPAPVVGPGATTSLLINGVQTTVPTFGQISSGTSNQDNYARRVQLGLKFLF